MFESEDREFDDAMRNTVNKIEMQQIRKDKGFVQVSRFREEDANDIARSSSLSPDTKRSGGGTDRIRGQQTSGMKRSPMGKKTDVITDLIVENLAEFKSEVIENGVGGLRIDVGRATSPTHPRKMSSPKRGPLRRMATGEELDNYDFAPVRGGSPTKFGTKGIHNDAVAHTKFPLMDRALSNPALSSPSHPQPSTERFKTNRSPLTTPSGDPQPSTDAPLKNLDIFHKNLQAGNPLLNISDIIETSHPNENWTDGINRETQSDNSTSRDPNTIIMKSKLPRSPTPENAFSDPEIPDDDPRDGDFVMDIVDNEMEVRVNTMENFGGQTGEGFYGGKGREGPKKTPVEPLEEDRMQTEGCITGENEDLLR